jgi:hypothetical protein
MMDNINSGADYANVVITSIIDAESNLPADQRLPSLLLTCWCQEIANKADETWMEYITGKRETFLMSDVEMKDLFDKAGMRYVGELVDGMVDNDVLETYVDDKGEILYGLTENGKKMMVDDIIKNNGEENNNNK